MLGFTGTTFVAAGFVPFATAPVTYSYDDQGFFITRRQSMNAPSRRLDAPRNILAALGVDRQSRRSISYVRNVTHITMSDYEATRQIRRTRPNSGDDPWQRMLPRYRELLESAWSKETMHPSYLGDAAPYPPSRGQCGVSSVWLARELRTRYDVEATYCYGKLSFETSPIEVDHHCWLEIGDAESADRLVVDLTYDQAEALNGKVLCAAYGSLRRQGIHYSSRTRLMLDELHADRVWHRFLALRDAVATARRLGLSDATGLPWAC
jgi:hypothetical protein